MVSMRHNQSPYQTSLGQAIFAIIAGTIIASIILTGITIFLYVVEGFGAHRGAGIVLLEAFKVWKVSTVVMFSWIVLSSIPWTALHIMGYRQWYVAIGLGALLGPVGTLVISVTFLTGVNFQLPLLIIPLIAGIAVGWLLWRIAYYKEEAE